MWLAGLCWGLACGRAGEVHTESLELARGPIPRTQAEAVAVPPVSDGAAPAADPEEPAVDIGEDSGRAALVTWLARECSGCHGSADDRPFADLDFLMASQLLLPGAAEVSPLVLWLQYGSSRREHAGIQVSPEEFDTLVGYVNAVPADNSGVGCEVVERDRVYELMALDITTREPADRPFIRYVGFANSEATCDHTRLERAAFVQLLNGVSLGPTVVPPGELNLGDVAVRPIYALDIRAYGWTAPVDVGAAHFEDHWSAIVGGVGDEAIELTGPEADVLKRETQTPIPFVTAAQFVTAAAVGDLYSALVGVGSNANELLESLGVDDALLWRGGVFGAGSQPDRVVTRREQRAFPGHSWWTRQELVGGAGAVGLGEDPVHVPNEGAEVIFTLPNGLFAFAIVASDGGSLSEIPGCIGGTRCPTAVRAQNSITCRACHAGLVSVTDEVLPYLDAEPGRYPAELEPLIREQYRADISRALEVDRVVHAAAAEAGGSGLDDIVARLYFAQTRRALDSRHAANDLGLDIDQLRAGIEALGSGAPELAPLLSGGTIAREQLRAHIVPLLCNIPALRNLPRSCP